MGKAMLKGGDFEAAYPHLAKAYDLTHDVIAANILIECCIGR
jgi:hypothetical protein